MGKVSGKRLVYGIAFLLLLSSLAAATWYSGSLPGSVARDVSSKSPDFYVGVAAAFSTVEDTKVIVDEVKSYTNFFVVGSTAITNDLAKITDVCQYLNDSGLYFLSYAHPAQLNFSQTQWVNEARQTWNSTFMGLYAYDEAGGHQIDRDTPYMTIHEANNYTDAAQSYAKNLRGFLSDISVGWQAQGFPLFTSDYVLHEFDYRSGYDVVLAELAWDNNQQLNIALDRGAATMHNKDWGVMITGSYNDSRYAFTGKEMYDDMVLAYQNGAKYILVFDYPNLAQGLLKQEHFDALKQFWQYTQTHSRTSEPADDRVAYVLPAGYGYGFRSASDKIWGLWEADNQSSKIWNTATQLTAEYASKLDIIYEDELPLNGSVYSTLIFWNGTILNH